MDNLKTIISWTLNDYCKSECSYCPVNLRGGGIPPETAEYLRIANLLIESYSVKQNRKIDWVFNGGEPLDMDDIAMLLKLCRTNGNSMTLHTNGGKLWMDWWAIEPYVDSLNLTFHHWQNPSLMKYIIQTFLTKNKAITVHAPIRHSNVDEDIERVVELEQVTGFRIMKTLTYKDADQNAGLYPYTFENLGKIDFWNKSEEERQRVLAEQEQRRIRDEEYRKQMLEELERIKNEPIPEPVYEPIVIDYERKEPEDIPPPVEERTSSMEEKIYFMETSWDDRYKDQYDSGIVYTGQFCNAGVESLNIGAQGWVTGSACGNQPLGNIWHAGWMPPQGPQQCTMISCIHDADQRITKFPLPAE